MHDIDRALFEGQPQGESWGELSGESHGYETPQTYELPGEVWGEAQAHEQVSNELALASELLEISGEDELDRFLGRLVSGAVSAAKSFVKSDAGRAVGQILRSSAKRAPPDRSGGTGPGRPSDRPPARRRGNTCTASPAHGRSNVTGTTRSQNGPYRRNGNTPPRRQSWPDRHRTATARWRGTGVRGRWRCHCWHGARWSVQPRVTSTFRGADVTSGPTGTRISSTPSL